jgi:hypothetical protein
MKNRKVGNRRVQRVGDWQLTPVILATQKAQTRRIGSWFKASPWQIVRMILS